MIASRVVAPLSDLCSAAGVQLSHSHDREPERELAREPEHEGDPEPNYEPERPTNGEPDRGRDREPDRETSREPECATAREPKRETAREGTVALSDRLTRPGPPACLEAPQQVFRCPVCHGFPTCLRAGLPVLVGGEDALRLNATAPVPVPGERATPQESV
jgi:hypothetical protein